MAFPLFVQVIISIMMNDSLQFEITLEKLTYGGEAMGRLADGRAVFVPFGLPGEVVKVRLVQEKQNYAHSELVEIVKSAHERIEPRCKHFTTCGGCHYQNLIYEKQLEVKTEILRDQLQRIGKIQNPPIQPIVASPQEWNYRNHIQFHLTNEGKLGFVRSLTPNASPQGTEEFILAITECHLPESNIDFFWPNLQFESKATIERVSLRSGMDDELMLVLESETAETPELEVEADISVVHIYQNHPVVIAGRDHLFINVLDAEFRVSAGSFFQVNTHMAQKMVGHVLANLPVSPSATLLDVYCGVGLFSKFLAPKYAKIIGIESSASACEDFTFNLDEFDHIELYEGMAEQILPAFTGHASSVMHMIVDPPRAGIEKHALDAIINLKPQIIIYVSCDPSTLARDAARLISGGYRLSDVTPFDLFPQTYHIESISVFELA